MGLLLDLICSVLAIPFFLLGIVSKALATLLQEMLKSAVYIAIDLFAALLVGLFAEFSDRDCLAGLWNSDDSVGAVGWNSECLHDSPRSAFGKHIETVTGGQ